MGIFAVKHCYDVIVIGAGAAGMAASITAAERGKRVLLLEKADRPGRKILASGNGRCNMMNSGNLRYYGDPRFAENVLRQCPVDDIAAFFNRYGLMLREEDEGRLYPVTNQAASVVSALRNAMTLLSVQCMMNSQVSSAEKNGSTFIVSTTSDTVYTAEKLIITCGGKAHPKLGGSDDGYSLLSALGHTLIPVVPSLVPLNTDSRSISGLSGIRIRCRVNVIQNDQILHSEDGEVLFSDYGVSGICIMQCARFVTGSETRLELNLMKDAFRDANPFREELLRRRKLFSSCSPVWLLNGILPEKLSYAVLKQAGIPMKGESCGEISESEIEHILHAAFHYRIRITGKRGFDQAQVTAGGISCAEFNPCTMESRIIPGLYAAGEVLDVDGDCGGFNLMFAFASGMIAGQNM